MGTCVRLSETEGESGCERRPSSKEEECASFVRSCLDCEGGDVLASSPALSASLLLPLSSSWSVGYDTF